jgi:hypothetical protein
MAFRLAIAQCWEIAQDPHIKHSRVVARTLLVESQP